MNILTHLVAYNLSFIPHIPVGGIKRLELIAVSHSDTTSFQPRRNSLSTSSHVIMYGILAFNKGEKAALAEFRAESGKYGRGSACKGCRISRVKCSGKLDATDCDRCKRLRMPCHYTNNPNRRNGSNINNNNNNSQARGSSTSSSSSSAAITPPKPGSLRPSTSSDSYPSSTTSSPRIDPTSWDEVQLVPDEFQLGLDFDMWLQLHSPEQTPTLGTGPKDNMSSTISPQTCWDPQSIQPLGQSEPSEPLHQQNGTGETSEANESMGITGQDLTDFKLFPILADEAQTPAPVLAPPGSSQSVCHCHPSTTSLLSILRGWALGGGPSARLGINTDGLAIDCSKIGDFLALFEESIVQLEMVKNCHMACIRSQDLAILLLLVVEQLAKLLLSLAANFPTEGSVIATGAGFSHLNFCSKYVSHRRPQISEATPSGSGSSKSDNSNNNNSRQGQDTRRLRIGSFEVKDAPDLLMITKILLQIRTRALDTYICRLSAKIQMYGLQNLEAELRNIREDLSRITGSQTVSPESLPQL